ncbi:MAG TPA: YlxR family protein [Pseudonocardiaceae bacterium]
MGCRAATSATELLRVVVVDGAVVPDPERTLPGRGAWLHVRSDCLRTAYRRRALPRAFRVPGELDVEPVRLHLSELLGESVDVGVPSRSVRARKQVDPS